MRTHIWLGSYHLFSVNELGSILSKALLVETKSIVNYHFYINMHVPSNERMWSPCPAAIAVNIWLKMSR